MKVNWESSKNVEYLIDFFSHDYHIKYITCRNEHHLAWPSLYLHIQDIRLSFLKVHSAKSNSLFDRNLLPISGSIHFLLAFEALTLRSLEIIFVGFTFNFKIPLWNLKLISNLKLWAELKKILLNFWIFTEWKKEKYYDENDYHSSNFDDFVGLIFVQTRCYKEEEFRGV